MARKVATDLSLLGNILQEFGVDNVASLPTTKLTPGRLVYLTAGEKGLYYYDSTAWKQLAIGGDVTGLKTILETIKNTTIPTLEKKVADNTTKIGQNADQIDKIKGNDIDEAIEHYDDTIELLYKESLSSQEQLDAKLSGYTGPAILLKSKFGIAAGIKADIFLFDGMVDNVSFDDNSKILKITFNTKAGKSPINVNLSKLVDTYNADGKAITKTNNTFGLKIAAASAANDNEFIRQDSNGLVLEGIKSKIAAAQNAAANAAVQTIRGGNPPARIDTMNEIADSIMALEDSVASLTESDLPIVKTFKVNTGATGSGSQKLALGINAEHCRIFPVSVNTYISGTAPLGKRHEFECEHEFMIDRDTFDTSMTITWKGLPASDFINVEIVLLKGQSQ